ncbi:hypothetical protein [Limnovirga soli]|uniref:Uncharacterized protein n=1 Tax=Limnovirga soli TaxID=2656915 RepID=A0A8J8FGX6_9BACT|nr:hypothetical protein [Limnovirga soli]NNV57688.1 hypothetical protein [Limnovirga soli]
MEYSSWGYSTKYCLTQDSILLKVNKNVVEKKMEDLYSRALTKKESVKIYQFLTSLSYDTLKDEYIKQGIYDATDIRVQLYGDGLHSKNVLLYISTTAITDTIEKLVQRHILDTNFQLRNLHALQ